MDRKINFVNEDEIEESKITVPFSRIVSEDDRKLPYRSRRLEPQKALHWGQRKLLLMEIEFLTNFGDLSDTVLYIGAADGHHIVLLAQLFPEHKFILYDPEEFHPDVKDIPDVEIHNELFTDNHVEKYKDCGILLISDIRIISEDYKGRRKYETLDDVETDVDLEEDVKRDMELQKKWHIALEPKASLLKFRLPYTPGITEYLKGILYYQMWAPSTSTECRLIVQGNDTTTYDNTDHESRMYRFNRCTRFQPFDMPIKISGIPNSYDLIGELYVLTEYLHKIQGKSMEEMAGFLNGMTVLLTRFFGKTLEDKYAEARDRYRKRVDRVEQNTYGRGRGRSFPKNDRPPAYNRSVDRSRSTDAVEQIERSDREPAKRVESAKPAPAIERSDRKPAKRPIGSSIKIIGAIPKKK